MLLFICQPIHRHTRTYICIEQLVALSGVQIGNNFPIHSHKLLLIHTYKCAPGYMYVCMCSCVCERERLASSMHAAAENGAYYLCNSHVAFCKLLLLLLRFCTLRFTNKPLRITQTEILKMSNRMPKSARCWQASEASVATNSPSSPADRTHFSNY